MKVKEVLAILQESNERMERLNERVMKIINLPQKETIPLNNAESRSKLEIISKKV